MTYDLYICAFAGAGITLLALVSDLIFYTREIQSLIFPVEDVLCEVIVVNWFLFQVPPCFAFWKASIINW